MTVDDDFGTGLLTFDVEGIPVALPTGRYTVSLRNHSALPHVLVGVGGLHSGMTLDEFIDLIDAREDGLDAPAGSFGAGFVIADAGHQDRHVFDLTRPGTYGWFCPNRTLDDVPHSRMGFAGMIRVTG